MCTWGQQSLDLNVTTTRVEWNNKNSRSLCSYNTFIVRHIVSSLLSMEPWAAAKKNFQLVWRCHQLMSGFLAKGHLPRVSRQSGRSLMIRVIMKWSWGGCAQISWHLPYSRGKPQKTSSRRLSDEGAVRPVIASNGVPFLQIRLVGSHSTLGREKKGIKERTGWDYSVPKGTKSL